MSRSVSHSLRAAIGIAMYIYKLQRRACPENEAGGNDVLPFGYKRAEVIGGMINSVALVALSGYVSHPGSCYVRAAKRAS